MPYFPAIDYQADYNPPVPYTTKIPGGLRVGMVVCVQAKLPSNYNRWAINFATGQEESSDVAFHLNARYDGPECVIFNSKQDEVWGEEEMKEDVPFKSGKVFVVMFEITENIYQVFVNGAPFYEFGHRIPLESVQWLQVVGDITIQELSILGNGQDVKDDLLLAAARFDLLPMLGPPIVNAPVPFSTTVRGGMIPKRTAIIKLMTKSKAKSFNINFKVGFNNDIALHINPRLSKKTLVRNSFVNGKWGKEETAVGKNPFKEGESYDISVRSGEEGFKVYVNGSHCFDYAHRIWNLQQVDQIEVDGDVNIVYVFV